MSISDYNFTLTPFIKRATGTRRGSLETKVTRIDISNANDKRLRMPKAREGNEFHRPPKVNGVPSRFKSTGLTTESMNERIMQTQQLPHNDIQIEQLDLLRE